MSNEVSTNPLLPEILSITDNNNRDKTIVAAGNALVASSSKVAAVNKQKSQNNWMSAGEGIRERDISTIDGAALSTIQV